MAIVRWPFSPAAWLVRRFLSRTEVNLGAPRLAVFQTWGTPRPLLCRQDVAHPPSLSAF